MLYYSFIHWIQTHEHTQQKIFRLETIWNELFNLSFNKYFSRTYTTRSELTVNLIEILLFEEYIELIRTDNIVDKAFVVRISFDELIRLTIELIHMIQKQFQLVDCKILLRWFLQILMWRANIIVLQEFVIFEDFIALAFEINQKFEV